jgi:hypothetical protein
MSKRVRTFILGVVATFGLAVAVGRPLLKLQSEEFMRGAVIPVFSMGLLESGENSALPVAVVP